MFPCTKCGCCCKRIGDVIENNKELSNPKSKSYFPYKYNKEGRCEMLLPDNTCKVYSNRPLICNIDKVIETRKLPKDGYYDLCIGSCNLMMEMEAVPREYRIDRNKKEIANNNKKSVFLIYE